MRFLWVNNLAALTGGTFQCTLSMIKSLPDCQHNVLALSGSIEGMQPYFGDNVRLQVGKKIREYIEFCRPDVVVYQNTSANEIPNSNPINCRTVYYLHSPHGGAKTALGRCDVSFIVSDYLATKVGADSNLVLHQPVHIPTNPDKLTRPVDNFVLGRICTPKPSKWKTESVLEPLQSFNRDCECEWLNNFTLHFVGATDQAKQQIGSFFETEWTKPKPKIIHTEASVEARALYHSWHCLVYSTEIEETYGRTVKEAQRCGCYPVVSHIGGFVEQIPGVRVGYLCKSKDDWSAGVAIAYERWKKPQQTVESLQEWGTQQSGLAAWRKQFLTRIS